MNSASLKAMTAIALLTIGSCAAAENIASAHRDEPPGGPDIDRIVSALVYPSGARWNQGEPLGTGVALNYVFAGQEAGYPDHPSYLVQREFTAPERKAIEGVLGRFSAVTDVSFRETSDIDAPYTIVFVITPGSGGAAGIPNPATNTDNITIRLGQGSLERLDPEYEVDEDDNWLWDPQRDRASVLSVIAHEVGHALGLRHPFTEETGSDGTVSFPPLLDEIEENLFYTVMSYAALNRNHTGPEYLTTHPIGPQKYDIVALQYLYGRNDEFRPQNDRYRVTDEYRTPQVIYDTGGEDVLDASEATRNVILNLSPGGFSSIATFLVPYDQDTFGDYQNVPHNNLAIDYGTMIESALGGYGDDRIIGNDMDNYLSGGPGGDTITPAGGSNTVHGGTGTDTVVYDADSSDYHRIDSGQGFLIVRNDSEGTEDRLRSVERLRFADRLIEVSSASYAPAALSTSSSHGRDTSAVIRAGLVPDQSMAYVDEVSTGQRVRIEGVVEPDSRHIGEAGEILVVVESLEQGQFLALEPSGRIAPVIPGSSGIPTFREIEMLSSAHQFTILDSTFDSSATGHYRLFLGYRIQGESEIMYNSEALEITIQ